MMQMNKWLSKKTESHRQRKHSVIIFKLTVKNMKHLTRPSITSISNLHFTKVSTYRQHRTKSSVDFRIIFKLIQSFILIIKNQILPSVISVSTPTWMSSCQNGTSSALSGHDSKIKISMSYENINQARSSRAQRGVKDLSYTAVKQPTCSAHPKQSQTGAAGSEEEGHVLCCPLLCMVSWVFQGGLLLSPNMTVNSLRTGPLPRQPQSQQGACSSGVNTEQVPTEGRKETCMY